MANLSVRHIIRARRRAYGHPAHEFRRVAAIWTAILKAPVRPQDVGLCLIALKLAREAHAHHADNLIDICGYADCLDAIHARRARRARPVQHRRKPK